MKYLLRITFSSLLSILALNAFSQKTITLDSTVLEEKEIAVGLQVPWEMLWGPDDHIWLTERRGVVRRLNPETGVITEILDIQSLVESEAEPGLLGMALAPDFANDPSVYLVYTYLESTFSLGEKLVKYTWDGSQLSNEVTILDGISAAGIHNGSRLLFTPDNKLLMTTGDVGSGNLSQNLDRLNGKLLRINPDGSIPDDNPFENSYVYTFGHRNSQGLAYGPDGLLFSSEHGAQSSDELNLIEEGRNYGWPTVQGMCNTNVEINFCEANNVREPLSEYTPCVAVNDLVYYNHSAIPEWEGKLLMAVLGGFVQRPRISVITLTEDNMNVESQAEYFDDYGRIRDICINPHDGSIYFATNGPDYPSSGPNKIIQYIPRGTSSTTDIGQLDYLKVYPNPVQHSSQISIELSEQFGKGRYQIFNFKAELMSEGLIENILTELNLEGLNKGGYYIQVSNASGMLSKPFFVH